jgi:hypothetical protein
MMDRRRAVEAERLGRLPTRSGRVSSNSARLLTAAVAGVLVLVSDR